MNRRWKMIGSFPVTFTERQASQFNTKHVSLFLYRAQNLTIFLFLLTKHDVNDIADPSSLQDAYHAWTSEWALPTTDSPWLSCRASEGGVRRFEVRFSWGLRIFSCPTLVTRRKKISFFISLAGSKSNHLSYSICYPVGIFQISQKVYA